MVRRSDPEADADLLRTGAAMLAQKVTLQAVSSKELDRDSEAELHHDTGRMSAKCRLKAKKTRGGRDLRFRPPSSLRTQRNFATSCALTRVDAGLPNCVVT